MPQQVVIATADQVPENSVRGFQYNDQRIAVYHVAGQWYATSNVCTHDDAEMSAGWLDTDDITIECPMHGAKFQIETGAVLALPAYQPLPVYPVTIADGQIVVELP
jgi:3-phenylpropionate/trans-cinnamate dioxygenase ferredoxin subunit